MLGTQATYDQSDEYILQMGFYYKLRSNSANIDYCKGQMIYGEFSPWMLTNTLVMVTSASQEISIPLSQTTLQSKGC